MSGVPTLRGVASNKVASNGGGISTSVGVPTGTLGGDTMLAIVTVRSSTSGITPPAGKGWQQISTTPRGTSGQVWIFQKAADGPLGGTTTETAGSWLADNATTNMTIDVVSMEPCSIDVDFAPTTVTATAHTCPPTTAQRSDGERVLRYATFATAQVTPGTFSWEAAVTQLSQQNASMSTGTVQSILGHETISGTTTLPQRIATSQFSGGDVCYTISAFVPTVFNPVILASGRNRAMDPDFVSPTALSFGNNGSGSTTSRDTTQGVSDLGCVRVDTTLAGDGVNLWGDTLLTPTLSMIPARVGQVVVLSAWIKGAVGGEIIYVQAQERNSSGSAIAATNSANFTLTTSWQRYWVIATVSSGSTVGVNMKVNHPNGGASTYYVDQVQFEYGALTTYVGTGVGEQALAADTPARSLTETRGASEGVAGYRDLVAQTANVRLAADFSTGSTVVDVGSISPTVAGAPAFVAGRTGSQALKFAATADGLTFPALDMTARSGFTLSMIARNDRVAKGTDYGSWAVHGATKWLALTNDANRVAPGGFGARVFSDNGSVEANSFGPRLDSTSFHHIMLAIDRSGPGMTAAAQLLLYVDGVPMVRLSTSTAASGYSSPWELADLVIAQTTARFTLEHLAVYDRQLTAAEAQVHAAEALSMDTPSRSVVLNRQESGAGGYRAVVVGDKPAAYWRLGETSGVVALDEMGGSSLSYTAPGFTLGASPGIVDEPNGAVTGTGAGGLGAASLVWNPAWTQVSVELWAKVKSGQAGTRSLLDWRGGTGTTVLANLFMDSNGRPQFWGTGGSGTAPGALDIRDDKWHHFVGTFDGTSLRLYVDGAQYASIAGAVSTTIGLTLRLGSDSQSRAIQADFDELAVYPFPLTAAQIAAHYNAGITGVAEHAGQRSYQEAVLGSGPATYWRLDETGATVKDAVAGLTGTMQGAGYSRGQPGLVAGDTATSFTGVDAYADLGDNSAYSFPTNVFTIEFWATLDPTVTQGVLGKRGSGGAGWEYSIFSTSAGTLLFNAWNSAGQDVYTAIPVTHDGQPHHWAWTADGTTAFVYRDGVLVGQVTKTGGRSMVDTASPFQIGQGGSGLGAKLAKGTIDEVATYARTLTQAEISAHYLAGQTVAETAARSVATSRGGDGTRYQAQVAATSGIVGRWKLDETSGTTFADDVGGRAGTLVGINTALGTPGLIGDPSDRSLTLGTTLAGVSVPDAAALDNTAFTVEVWALPSLNPAGQLNQTIVGKEGQFLLRIDSANTIAPKAAMYIGTTLNSYQGRQVVLSAGQIGVPLHIVITCDGTVASIYVNGVLGSSLTLPSSPVASSTNPLTIGSRNLGSEQYTGMVDEVAYYNRALTAAEVAQHYTLAGERSVAADTPTRTMTLARPAAEAIQSTDTITNLHPNPSVETDAANWSALGPSGAGARTIADAQRGAASFEASFVNVAGAGAYWRVLTNGVGKSGIPITGGATYQVRLGVKPVVFPAGPRLRIRLDIYDVNGSFVTNPTSAPLTPVVGQWQDLTMTFVAPSNAAFVVVELDSADFSQPAMFGQAFSLRIDGVELVRTDVAVPPYFEGTVSTAARQATMTRSRGYREMILAAAPLSYWRLGDVGVPFADETGAAPGTSVVGPGVTTGQPGALVNDGDPSVSFPGNGGIDCGDVYDMPGQTPFSVELWALATADATFRRAVSTEYATNKGWDVGLQSSGWFFSRFDDASGGDTQGSTSAPLKPGVWQHIVATYDGSTIALYVDGVLTGSRGSTRQITASGVGKLRIGCQGSSAGSAFVGRLDEVTIYPRALSAAEISSHYMAGGGQGGEVSVASDAPARSLVTNRTKTETSGAVDTVPTRSITFTRSPTETSLAADSLSRSWTGARRPSEVSFAADQASRLLTHHVAVTESSTAQDSVNVILTPWRFPYHINSTQAYHLNPDRSGFIARG